MNMIVEDGTGVYNANSYAGRGFVSSYLIERNRATSWLAADEDVQEAAIIAATDYIDKRFGQRFLGQKLFEDFVIPAENILQIRELPSDGDTITIDTVTYTFRVAPAIANEIAIGATIVEAAGALVAAMAGTGGGAGTVAHPSASSGVLRGTATVIVRALVAGPLADPILTSSSNPLNTFDYDRLIGGTDKGTQRLEFPRTSFLGIPVQLRQAVAEYAERAIADKLMPDPEVEATGGQVTRTLDKIGPIEIEREYLGGAFIQIFRKYPEADRLLISLTRSGGGVTR